MGSNFANDLVTLGDLGVALDIESQIGIHLRSNHYPPVPLSMVQPCIEAIDAVNDAGLWNLEIPLPEGIATYNLSDPTGKMYTKTFYRNGNVTGK